MELKEYLIAVVALSGVLGVILLLSHPDTRRECEAAVLAVSLGALVTPILSLVPSVNSFPELSPEMIPAVGGVGEVSESAFSEGIESYLCSEYSLDKKEISVQTRGFSLSEMRAEEITVKLSGGAVLADIPGMKLCVRKNFTLEGGVCEVVIVLGSEE